MLGLRLREEFAGRRLSGTTIDFSNRQGTGALDRGAKHFLSITYQSTDFLKILEAVQSERAQPVVIIGARGQGKSHLMAALSHILIKPDVGEDWLNDWAGKLDNEAIGRLSLLTNMHVIAESLHLQKYKFLWDLLFACHPGGIYIRGKWEGQGDSKTDVPGYDLLVEMFKKQPTMLILDEFQTWFEGLTNTKQYPWRNWAFNFIQILSEISENHPDVLSLVVSVREGDSDAAQQIYRVNPARIDFKGPQAKRDRQRLLLYRLFENRMHIPTSDIEALIKPHVEEYLRLYQIPGSEQEKHRHEFIESWPFSPKLMQLLDDQVLIATDTQETRDLLRILVDVFKQSGETSPVITAADFSLINEKSGVASLLDSVANQLHRDLRSKALRNLEAVQEAVGNANPSVPHLSEILSAVWLRSLSLENKVGAEAHELQVDITRDKVLDDNRFATELAVIEENSFNIHRKGNCLIFLNEENPQAKLMAHAKNDRLFEDGSDLTHLANEIRYVLAGDETNSHNYRVIVLGLAWSKDPWSEVDERDWPQHWDNRIPVIVVPSANAGNAELGQWLKCFVSKHRNTVRYLLPKKGTEDVFYDKALLVLSRAVHLAQQWKTNESAYASLHTRYQKELRDQLKNRFDRFAILETWNFAKPEKCVFQINSHHTEGAKILEKIQDTIHSQLFIPEELADLVIAGAKKALPVYEVLSQLKEPMSRGKPCLPWLGETDAKEQIMRLCAQGMIAINVLGCEMLQSCVGETEEAAWQRMKGRLGLGRQLEQTTLHEPDASVTSGGSAPLKNSDSGSSSDYPMSTDDTSSDPLPPHGLFGGVSGVRQREQLTVPYTSSLNLLGKLEGLGINDRSQIFDLKVLVEEMSGAQLHELLKKLPDGVTYSLVMEKG